VRSLYKIIEKFAKKIYELFRLDIHKYPTLPSLSFAIYRSNFLNESFQIPLINGEMYKDLKIGYTGGSVDVYKPYGETVYVYDVNSLYPYVMKSFPMPIGQPTYFEGDINIKYKRPFGIFDVEITAPEDLNIPILQHRLKTINGHRTISPLGS
jgi:hypothetical protein